MQNKKQTVPSFLKNKQDHRILNDMYAAVYELQQRIQDSVDCIREDWGLTEDQAADLTQEIKDTLLKPRYAMALRADFLDEAIVAYTKVKTD